MFFVEGLIHKIFDDPGFVHRDTGEVDPDKPQVQILGEIPLRNGQSKSQLESFSVSDPSFYKPFKGRFVKIPFTSYTPAPKVLGKQPVTYYALAEGVLPVLLDQESL